MESITTCEVCYVNYDTKDHAPRVLSCGHTMCTECLTNILKNPALRKCSFDNIAFTPNQISVTSFPLNFIVINMLEQKKNNACKTHPDERLKLICLTDKAKICSECARSEEHKDHDIKKIKTLKAQGVKVKGELQQSLLNIKDYELAKDRDCEQIRKVFVRTITEQFKEIKEILVEKEFELVQQANSLFDADKTNYIEGTFAWKQQIDETIKDITHACQDENGDIMILDKEVRNNDQNITKKRTQFLKEKSGKVQKKIIDMQNSLKDALVNSKISINSLQLSAQEVVKEIYSVHEESEQLTQEELARKDKNLKRVKFTSYFDIFKSEGRLVISAKFPQLKEVEINLAELQTIKAIRIQLDRYDTLRNDPLPNVLSYLFHGLKNVIWLNAYFKPANFKNDSLLWLGGTIQNHIQNLKTMALDFTGCKFNDDSMPILCRMIFYKTISLKVLSLDLSSCHVIDKALKILAESLKSFHKNLTLLGLRLQNNDLSGSGVQDILKEVQNMKKLEELRLNLWGLQLSNEVFKMLGESVLPRLKSLDSLYLWLASTPISDECLALILKNLPNLKKLDIDFSQTLLTDKTLEMFIEKVLPRLEILESFSFKLEGTRVNKKNLDKIQEISKTFEKKKLNN